MKRFGLWALAVVGIIGGAIGFWWTFFAAHEITITQEQIQEKIDAKVPMDVKDVTVANRVTLAKDVKVTKVQLDLTGNQIGVAVTANSTIVSTPYHFEAKTLGTMRYDTSAGAFYFHPEKLALTKAEADGVPVSDKVSDLIDKVSDPKNVNGFVRKWSDSKKVNDFVEKWADPGTKIVRDHKDEIMEKAKEGTQALMQQGAEMVLNRVPVYTLPDDIKGNTIRVLVEDVRVHDDVITVHLSLWKLTKYVIGWFLLCLLALALLVLLVVKPEVAEMLLMPFALFG